MHMISSGARLCWETQKQRSDEAYTFDDLIAIR